MADYSVVVQGNLQGFEKLDEIERQIEKIQEIGKSGISISLNGLDTKDIGKFVSSLEKQLSSSLGKSIGSNKFKMSDLVDFTDSKKAQKQVESYLQTVFKGNNASKKEISNWSKEYMSNVIKEAENQQKKLEQLNNNRSKIYSNYEKERLQSLGKRDPIFDDMKAYYQKQEKLYSNINKEKNKFDTLQYDVTKSKYRNQLSDYVGQDKEYINKAREAYKIYEAEVDSFHNKIKNKKFANQDELDNASRQVEKYALTYENAMQIVRQEETKTLKPGIAQNSANSVRTYIENNTKAWGKYKTQLEQVEAAYKNVVTVGDKNKVDAQFKTLKSTISAEGLTGKSPFQQIASSFKNIGQFTMMYGMIKNGIQQIPVQMVNAVRDVNAAQIELVKVSDASPGQISQYWNQAAESAKKYGATISDVISSTADWSRLGYGLNEAQNLSDMTTLLQKVGDNMTQETASQGLVSTLKGFEMQADEAQKIVDVANQIANTQPIDTAGIFEAMERSASSLHAAGNSFEQSVALATSANSVVQDSLKVGNALKTMGMRIRGASTELEEAGLETDGMAESTAKLQKEIKALSGVDIMKNENEFKSTYDILDELANKWSDLTDIQQARITELIAGGIFDSASIYRNINKRTYLIARAA